jgi:hypothetical protein
MADDATTDGATADGYYGEDAFDEHEVDLSFLDDDDDTPDKPLDEIA